jgi:hypothetical protein
VIVAFTGTRKGMTKNQKKGLRKLLHEIEATEFDHGDCIGADAEADAIASDFGCKTVAHPCDIKGMRAHCNSDFIMSPKPPLVRNRLMVDRCIHLVAAPKTKEEELRSGTWATIRYAREQAKKRKNTARPLTITILEP